MCFSAESLVTECSLSLTWDPHQSEEYITRYLLKGNITLNQLQPTEIFGTSVVGFYLSSEVQEALLSSVATEPRRPVDVIVDFKGRGPIIPQKYWTPHTLKNRQDHVEKAMLHLPIYFVGDHGKLGVSYAHAVDEAPTSMLNGGEAETFSFGKSSVELRVCLWPYKPKEFTIHLGKKALTPLRLAQMVFSHLKNLFENPPELDIKHEKYVDWKIGGGNIELHDILLIGIVQVSSGSVVPIMQLANEGSFRWLPGRDEDFTLFAQFDPTLAE